MSKSRPKTRWSLIVILLVSFALSYLGFKYYVSTKAQPLSIMAIEPIELTYGDTTISGVLQKDAPAGAPGTFLLVLPDMRPVLLDVQGVDNLLGTTVSISGNLVPAKSPTSPMTMTVKTITVAK